ncbi:hypothetical protein DCCM_2152 [Desulfocucumis palustris]|uniref:Uncharacterized protein n=1 Tax=Desulfocucumis palustris TaxID=1898651 RepID=A0A2L2XA32_9FIRM|nr:hypothetical protein DCCM_2152 [Desulfocucumis palustris]
MPAGKPAGITPEANLFSEISQLFIHNHYKPAFPTLLTAPKNTGAIS